MARSDIEIKAEIAAERLVFEPPIPDPDQFGVPSDESRFGSSSIPIELSAGMRIAQLVLEHVGLPPIRGYRGRYSSTTVADISW